MKDGKYPKTNLCGLKTCGIRIIFHSIKFCSSRFRSFHVLFAFILSSFTVNSHDSLGFSFSYILDYYRPAYLYRFSRDIPILALNHDFPISCGGVPILEDAGIFRARRFRFVLFLPVFRRFLNLSASCTYRQSRRCVAAINSPPGAMSQC